MIAVSRSGRSGLFAGPREGIAGAAACPESRGVIAGTVGLRPAKARAIAARTGFYDACAEGIFCNLGQGDVDFPAVRQVLLDAGFDGWCTVEQDCDPAGDTSPVADARANRDYLESIGFVGGA